MTTLQRIHQAVLEPNYVRPAKLNVFIADVSGSMHPHIKDLKSDTIVRMRKVPLNDGILFGIFSSERWFRWIAAAQMDSQRQYELLEKKIHEEVYARDMTCFSEIISDTPKQIELFLNQYQVITFTFFSDGVPVTSNNTREREKLRQAAQDLAPYISAGTVLAYGDYADRKLLGELAQILGIEFITTQHLQEIGQSFSTTLEKKSKKRTKVAIPQKSELVFAVESDGKVTTIDNTAQEAQVSAEADVFVLHKDVVGVESTAVDVQYAAILALLNSDRYDDALQMLASIGDVFLVNALNNALTNSEFAYVEKQLREAVDDPRKRFRQGCVPNCIPADDAFDILNLLDVLMEDDTCKFYPMHPYFQYKRIGRSGKTRDGYPTFMANTHAGAHLHRLTWHSSELNLSLGCTLPGTIILPDVVLPQDTSLGLALDRMKLNLRMDYETYIHRNYALINNGLLNVTYLPITASKKTLDLLKKHDVIERVEGDITVLNLSRIPICNKKHGQEAADWQAMSDLAVESLHLGSITKVLRAKRNELDPERVGDRPVMFTDEQYLFLETCGIKRDGSFSPPVDMDKTTDVIDIRVLELKIKHGSAVSMLDFAKMLSGEKKINYVGELMMKGHTLLEKMPKRKANALSWLSEQLETYESRKKKVDFALHSKRFAAIMSGQWRKGVPGKDSMVCHVDGTQVTLQFRTIPKGI